jgi:phage terminase small subunit
VTKQVGGVHQRRTRFIKEYLLDQNATRAAIAAGYSEKTAGQQGSRLLKDVKVKQEIEQKNAETNKSLDLTADRIKLEIARLCYYDPAAFFDANGSPKSMAELDEDSRRAIAGFETAELFSGSGEDRAAVGYIKKFKLPDKAKALELAAKIQRLLVDRQEITGKDGAPLETHISVSFVTPNATNS